MATVYMVRHGKARVGDGLDPGLDDLGREQASATAAALRGKGPLPIFSSPFARARQTSEPLARLWGREATIEPRVAEIPFPTTDLGERSRWLSQAMAGSWLDLGPELLAWRNALVDCVKSQREDCVIFCHFIAINVAVGAARADNRVVIFQPDNGSVTSFDNGGGTLRLVQLGNEAQTRIN